MELTARPTSVELELWQSSVELKARPTSVELELWQSSVERFELCEAEII